MLREAVRAALMDRGLYKEMDEGPRSMLQALGVVAAAAIAFGLGVRNLPPQTSVEPPPWVQAVGEQNVVMLAGASSIILGWGIWACVAYLIGTRLLGGKAGYRRLLRALGIAYGPALLLVLFGIPRVGGLAYIVAIGWLLMAGTVALRETQGFGMWRAFVPSVLGWFLAVQGVPFLLLSR